MSNRPTPETDAVASPHIGFYSCATVTANFARRLEIERDEVREELYDIRLNLGEDAEGYTLTHAVCVLQQERDEAREGRDKIQTELEMWRDGNILHEVHRNELEKVEQERNEAREEAHSFRSFYYAKTGINKGGCAFPWEEKLNE
jgi:hypothetical protein